MVRAVPSVFPVTSGTGTVDALLLVEDGGVGPLVVDDGLAPGVVVDALDDPSRELYGGLRAELRVPLPPSGAVPEAVAEPEPEPRPCGEEAECG
ncbi:hypothetical protein GCM10009839_64940 [Catenulispora yoronensis]|uniref:Uncharacterized protein n=1 Tax=Catenulispora yoronensis TaxID=450799 RepID=A0ABN2V2P1_9ACTN